MAELRIRCVRCGKQRPVGEGLCPACGAPAHPHKSTVEEFEARMDRLHGVEPPRRQPRGEGD